VGEFWHNLHKITNSDAAIDTQTVGFDEHTFLFQPCEEVIFHAVEFDAAEAAVAEHIAANAYVCLTLLFNASHTDFKILFEGLLSTQK